MYPEKLTFEGIGYRTSRLNEAVELIYKLGEGFSENKRGQISTKTNLSSLVAPPRFELRQTVPKTVVLPLYYRAIRIWTAKIRIGDIESKRFLWEGSC